MKFHWLICLARSADPVPAPLNSIAVLKVARNGIACPVPAFALKCAPAGKSRLAKVILMIMIVTLCEEALNMQIGSPIGLLYLGGSIALIALALYLSHAADHDSKNKEDTHNKQ